MREPELDNIRQHILAVEANITDASTLSSEPAPAKTRTTRYEIAACEGGTGDGSRRIITPIGVVDASSGPAAIRAYYAQDQTLTASIRLRATPVRNITELDVSVEQVQQVKFS
jgi:hypothetical protein